MIARRPLSATMSQYLIERIEGLANVEIVTGAEIAALEGAGGVLEAVTWRDRASGAETRRPARFLFSFIGAEPNTDWLAASGLSLDDGGFVCTGGGRGGRDGCRSRPAAAASSPSATSAPARSSASPPRSATARRSVASVHAWLAAAPAPATAIIAATPVAVS